MKSNPATAEQRDPPGAATVAGHADIVRERLQQAGLRCFAEQGYAKTSIRQITTLAQANVAAVNYYFGDKAGLYRAVFRRSVHPGGDAPAPPISSLDEMFTRFLEPLRQGDAVRLWVKLYRREMLEPTGLWQEKIANDMQPMHAALLTLLCRRLDLRRVDDDVQRLAISITGLAVHLFVGCDMIDALAPQLADAPDSIDIWRDRLVHYAEAMIGAERRRRRLPARTARAAAPRQPSAKTTQRPTQRRGPRS